MPDICFLEQSNRNISSGKSPLLQLLLKSPQMLDSQRPSMTPTHGKIQYGNVFLSGTMDVSNTGLEKKEFELSLKTETENWLILVQLYYFNTDIIIVKLCNSFQIDLHCNNLSLVLKR